ncbi:uncharacterized protein LOC124185487 isoform X1 [Neodiprion fabricii]|uniref:uncharacterized protein LOC124185487 isoform X1 n=1 Tax=Neodiprion fabricii TaxID=2872261 RepID=UPI001ED96F2F|nr:uncharacterized protein LOC124185487 isoform X1 [Neodiprion fabricii]XP_046432287.1 uncharacterized protein LOC124185487 isoform X1 [Neodiprion fabricii]
MEIMEDGNLVDRVRILLQRDMKYYQEKQMVLSEPICVGISGGKLDFPRHASFASTKIVAWWEAEFTTTFKESSGLSFTSKEHTEAADCTEVVKHSEPSEFVAMIVDTSEQLLEHLHTLTQEALDHADLTVLTATLGAAALVRNCLWNYNKKVKTVVSAQACSKLHKWFKSYQEMAEALAERLLDLHCRLISLYILTEANSLDWQSNQPFFEKERCSYVIQMWWLYMQGTHNTQQNARVLVMTFSISIILGTKEDLWNTVPPKMAQRVFSGMLDESLTILTVRFVHGRPSLARCQQFWADVFNVLCCTANLSLATFVNANEMVGFNVTRLSIISRDIHAKCGELLVSLLLRGTPLNILYQVLRNGLENLNILLPRRGPAPWLIMSSPHLLPPSSENIDNLKQLADGPSIALEIKILRAQPQPDWGQLMKILLMREHKISALLFQEFVKQSNGYKSDDSFTRKEKSKVDAKEQEGCGGFLCSGQTCSRPACSPALWAYSLTYISIIADMDAMIVIIPALLQDSDWSNCLDRHQVWNQIRPPWLHALITPLYPIMVPIVTTLLDAIKTGASIYQTMSLALACFSELYICTPAGLLRTASRINNNIPANCHPIGGSVLLQIMCAALYTNFSKVRADPSTNSTASTSSNEPQLVAGLDRNDTVSLAIALGEAICSIDEDDKHTLQISSLLSSINERLESDDLRWPGIDPEGMPYVVAQAYADELLLTSEGRLAIKVIHEYVVHGSDWILNCLGIEETSTMTEAPKYIPNSPGKPPAPKPLLHMMFHIGSKPFDQLLVDYMQADWLRVLKIPQAITIERLRSQILKRPEFKDTANLPQSDKEIIEALKLLCSTRKSSHLI